MLMKRTLIKVLFYCLTLSVLILLILEFASSVVSRQEFLNHETESNLLFYKKNTNYDVLIMGISHARHFSRFSNHLRVEKILQRDIINIGKAGCGINEQLFYLDYFYFLENQAKQVVFVLSPHMFFEQNSQYSSTTFDFDPFEISFFFRYLLFESVNKRERLMSYLKSKLTINWIRFKPTAVKGVWNKIDSVDLGNVDNGQDKLFGCELSMNQFVLSSSRIKDVINLALDNDSEVILIIPPASFGKWRGHEFVSDFAQEMASMKKVQFYDCSRTVLNTDYYYDHHHLNSPGVNFYTTNILSKILEGTFDLDSYSEK